MAHVLGIDIYRHSMVSRHARCGPGGLALAFAGLVLAAAGPAKAGDSSYFPDSPEPVCSTGPITANVVAMDQVITYNRMGAFAPAGMIFALARDVFPKDHAGPFDMENSCAIRACSPGNVMLRPDKRPRPLTLRVNEGCKIEITLTNLLFPTNGGDVAVTEPIVADALNEAPGINLCEPNLPAFDGVGVESPPRAPTTVAGNPREGVCRSEQPATRNVGIHVHGLNPVADINDDGSNVGRNASSLVAPGANAVYTLEARREGTFGITSGPNLGGQGGTGPLASGLFGVLVVEPEGTVWYRSQVTREEMIMAATGKTAGGHPILDYDAVFPTGHPYAGSPILKLLQGTEIVHNELDAVIHGEMLNDKPQYQLYPDRSGPFREHVIVFHDEVKMVQAFPEWYAELPFTLGSVKDGFAVNYGTGGVGSEVIGNRLGVGPMHECAECKYEEFFLTSWAVGDPAMIVDVPANQGLELCGPLANDADCDATKLGPKATRAFYPDDPSNVHHGYLSDRTKVRNVHFGTEHHIFHLHAHQWNFSNRDGAGREGNQSNYIDSQGIGPESAFTYEITFGGGGNRHKQVGDAIFHCHFYPHFAQGMWGLWRVHDTFEIGSEIDPDTGAVRSRGLPDSEICVDENGKPTAGGGSCGGYRYVDNNDGTWDAEAIPGGTPVPGVVPLPGKALAPMPGVLVKAVVPVPDSASSFDENGLRDKPSSTEKRGLTVDTNGEEAPFLGFPFYIAGKAGHRPPTPPLDLVRDGGLPRHIITAGHTWSEATATSFDKVLEVATGEQLPEEGTLAERVAMAFHAKSGAFHDTWTTEGADATGPDGFEVNGLPPNYSAPYAEPCRNDGLYMRGDAGTAVGNPRFYAATLIELPITLNKVGWHFAQGRIIVLDEDVEATLAGTRAPEPFVMRGNTYDCIDFNHTNLIPSVYQLDDFQVKTPTDVIGQHIHLVKFDVTSADGAANGWNYEDATLSMDEVHERLVALQAPGGAWNGDPLPSPEACETNGTYNNCARTTRQRWFIDPGWSGNVFTHDHLGPSTHQQAGLYATLLVEPEGSQWRDPVSGEYFGSRPDGGPTSWRADILTAIPDDSHREFYLEFGDFQLAYRAGEKTVPVVNGGTVTLSGDGAGGADPINFNGPNQAVNPSYRNEVGLPHVLQSNASPLVSAVTGAPLGIPGCGQNVDADGTKGNSWTGCAPEAISAADPGTFVVNMRNEPLPFRVRDPLTNKQNTAIAGDLSFAYQSRTDRADPRMNTEPESWPYGIQTATQGAEAGDPFTPLLRVYEGDKVSIRVQVGAHEEGHNFSINGIRWLQNWQSGVSGFRNSQFMGISEYFFFNVPSMMAAESGQLQQPFADYLYQTGSSSDAKWNGSWGLMRAYDGGGGQIREDLLTLPNNPEGEVPASVSFTETKVCSLTGLPCNGDGTCPTVKEGKKTRPQSCQTTRVQNPPVFAGACPRDESIAPRRRIHVVAVRAADVLPDPGLTPHAAVTFRGGNPGTGGAIVYNDKQGRELWDPSALMYVLKSDLDANGKLKADRRVEPLILRANAGDCVIVELENRYQANPIDFDGFNTLPMIVHQFGNNQVAPSREVGLHAQLVEYDVSEDDGMNVGQNPVQTACMAGGPSCPNTVSYTWYAGRIAITPGVKDGSNRTAIPVEYGTINLSASDPIKGGNKGLIGALIIQPKGAVWAEAGERGADGLYTRAAVSIREPGVGGSTCSKDPDRTCSADSGCQVTLGKFCSNTVGTQFQKSCNSNRDCRGGGGSCVTVSDDLGTCEAPVGPLLFRDFVAIHQDDVNLLYAANGGTPLPTVSQEEEPEDSGGKGINYRTDPIWHRLGKAPVADAKTTRTWDYTDAFSSKLGEPQTPIWTARVGDDIRIRILKPAGHNRNSTPTLHGHLWPMYPYSDAGPGDCSKEGILNYTDCLKVDHNEFDSSRIVKWNDNTFWHGEQMGHGPSNHIDVVPLAGCPVAGDFLYRDMAPVLVDNGVWAVVRCEQQPSGN